jgi:SagB-type dehydrogenase family enzyme
LEPVAALLQSATTTAWRKYHEVTKHSSASLRRNKHFLNWANLPDPFRHYEGVPVIDLPADPPAPEVRPVNQSDWIAFLSSLLFYSVSISAAKQAPSGDRYALRVNPSSGNLHPTEFHFACPNGLYHYRVSSHMLEQRAKGDFGTLEFLLTTIVWREAWKYQNRAYRYCLHDVGHAWQSLALAAAAMGCQAQAVGQFDDDAMAKRYGLAEDEWPMLLIEIHGAPAFAAAEKNEWMGGVPNTLSTEIVRYPLIEEIHAATRITRTVEVAAPWPAIENNLPLGYARFGELVRRRRSALDFRGGSQTIGYEQLMTLLESATRPLNADFASENFVQLYLYVHRVSKLAPGVYRYMPGTGISSLLLGDQRVVAAGLSLGQDLAGNSCVTFSMIGNLERAAQLHGDRGYRYVHFEAGAIGQRLYLAAEALGFQSTGIGAFFDDSVHDYLGIDRTSGRQVVYHFACGYAVEDDRLVPCPDISIRSESNLPE